MNKIKANNRQDTSSLPTPIDEKYEYKKIKLDEYQSRHIYIPLSVITDTEMSQRRVGIFSYLRIHLGLNNMVNFTVPDMVEWCGGKPDRRTNGTNDKFLFDVDSLSDVGYFIYNTERSKSSFIKCRLDTKLYYEDCKYNGYAVLYLDEIDKILSYKKDNSNDGLLNNTTILLVFAYLRNKIRRRSNELKPEERSSDGIIKRRNRMPDAYSCNLNEIAEDVGVSEKTLYKIINILEYELELIVTDRPFRIKNEDDEFRTPPSIFANAYKREDKYLLDTGENYSRNEIELKAENIKKYFKGYKIDKRKRTPKGGNLNE